MILSKGSRQGFCLVFVLGIAIASSAFGGSAVIGSVAGSANATIGGQTALPNTTILSGDSLQVNDGAAVAAIDDTSRMVFGRDTTVSFLRDANEITVMLSRGSLSMYHPQGGAPLRIKIGSVSVLPAKGFKTLGEVAMVGGSVVVTAKEGSLRVEGDGSAVEVPRGKTITLPTKAARAAGSSPAAPQALGSGAALQAAALGAGSVAAVLSGISISRANDARDAANAANSTAAGAVAAANSATSAANAAASSGTANATTINLVGCAIDKVTPNVTVNGTKVSPYTPPAGSTCP